MEWNYSDTAIDELYSKVEQLGLEIHQKSS